MEKERIPATTEVPVVDINTINFVLSSMTNGVETKEIISQLRELGKEEEEVDAIFAAARDEFARRQEEQKADEAVVPVPEETKPRESVSLDAEPDTVTSSEKKLSPEEREAERKRQEELDFQDIVANARVLSDWRKAGKTDEEYTQKLTDLGWSKKGVRRIFGMVDRGSSKRNGGEKIPNKTPSQIVTEAKPEEVRSLGEESVVPLLGYTPRESADAPKSPERIPVITLGEDLHVKMQRDLNGRAAYIHSLYGSPSSGVGSFFYDSALDELLKKESHVSDMTPESVFLPGHYGEAPTFAEPEDRSWNTFVDQATAFGTPVPKAEETGVIIPNPEDALEESHVQELLHTEGTPKEWKDTLRGLIDGAKEKLGMSKRAEQMSGYIGTRSQDLNKESKNYGAKIENFIRAKGEEYNKLSLTKKLIVGGVLGVGTVAFSTVSTPLATALAINLGLQRAAGMASMFLKIERHLQKIDEKFNLNPERNVRDNKIIAAVLAVSYTSVVGGVIGGAVQFASESAAGQAVHEWLGGVLGHHAPVAESGSTSPFAERIAPAGQVDVAQSAAAAAAIEAPASSIGGLPVVPASETAVSSLTASVASNPLSSIDIEATKGHGSEYMMKRLWDDLNTKGIKISSGANPDSDLAQLLSVKPGDEAGIKELVHKLASDPKHGFFNPDGTSVQIGENSHMTIDAQGNIQLDGATHVAEGAKMTSMHNDVVPHASGVQEGENANIDEATRRKALEWVTNKNPVPSAPAVEEMLGTEVVQEPAPAQIPAVQETVVAPRPITTEHYLVDSNGNAVLDSQKMPVRTGAGEILSGVNAHGISVPAVETHLYAGEAGKVFVYGGSPENQAKSIQEYLSENPSVTVYGAGPRGVTRVPWTMVGGVVTKGAEIKSSGILGLFATFAKAPEPSTFEKIIK